MAMLGKQKKKKKSYGPFSYAASQSIKYHYIYPD